MIKFARRITGLLLRTRSLGFSWRLFGLGEQGRHIAFAWHRAHAVEKLLDLKNGHIREHLLELTSDLPFLSHLNREVERGRRELSKQGTWGQIGEFQLGPLLYAIIRCKRPGLMVETGVNAGVSSAYILRAMEIEDQGALYSIDLPSGSTDPEYLAQLKQSGILGPARLPVGFTTGWAVPERLKKRWTLIIGDTRVELPKLLERLGTIGVFFHDSNHSYENMLFEFELAHKHLVPGGLLVSDDIARHGAFKDFQARVQKPSYQAGIGILFNS